MSYKLLVKYTLALCCIAALASCSDDDSFTPGDKPVCGDVTAYFSSDYKAQYVYDHKPVRDSDSIAVIRSTKSGALSIPIIKSGDDAVIVSSSADFTDGKDTTYIYITAPQAEFLKESDFTLNIPAEYSNPYKSKDGTTILQSSILYSTWDVVVDTVLFYSGNGEFPTQGCKLENLRGQNRFRFTNFLNSGNPLEFSIKCDGEFDATDMKKNVGEFIPLSNYSYASNGWWYFTNPGADGSWYNYITPAGKTDKGESANTIEFISFWPGRSYSNVDLRLEDVPDTTTITYKSKGIKKYYLCDYSRATNAHYGTLCSWVDYKDENISSNYVYFYLSFGYLLREEKIEN